MNPSISIVAPVYNEEEGIREFIAEVAKTMRAQPLEWELVLVNDGSSDRTLEILKAEKIQCPEIA